MNNQLENNDPFGLSRLDDPEFEASERARLTVSDEGEIPPPEMQKTFVDYVESIDQHYQDAGNNVDLKVVPEALFYASRVNLTHRELNSRRYYKRLTQGNFSFSDISAELFIDKSANGNYSGKISKYGEGPSFTGGPTEHVEVYFTPPSFKSQNGVAFEEISIDAEFAGKNLAVKYDQGGELSAFDFDVNNSSEIRVRNFPIKRIMEEGEAEYISGNIKYQAKVDSETGFISIELLTGGNSEDNFVIPYKIDGKRIFEELVPKPLFDNLQQADLDADKTWKDFSLRTFGIKWDMPSEIQNPSQ